MPIISVSSYQLDCLNNIADRQGIEAAESNMFKMPNAEYLPAKLFTENGELALYEPEARSWLVKILSEYPLFVSTTALRSAFYQLKG